MKCGINNDELLRTIWEHKKNQNREKRANGGRKGGFCFVWNLAERARTLHMYNRNFLLSGRVRSKDQFKQIVYSE
jgi:hypothetical protein